MQKLVLDPPSPTHSPSSSPPHNPFPPSPALLPGANVILFLHTCPIEFLESLPHLLWEFDCLPLAVLIQEAHLPCARLPKARAMVHRLLPAYYLFASRQKRGDDSSAAVQSQVVTLVHVTSQHGRRSLISRLSTRTWPTERRLPSRKCTSSRCRTRARTLLS